MTAQLAPTTPPDSGGVAASPAQLVLVLPAGDFCPAFCPVHGGYPWRPPRRPRVTDPRVLAELQRGLYRAMGL